MVADCLGVVWLFGGVIPGCLAGWLDTWAALGWWLGKYTNHLREHTSLSVVRGDRHTFSESL